jgi:uncharacterized protein YceK
MKKTIIVLVILFSISACGTMRTVPEKAQLKLKHSSKLNANTCKKIPRIYSGVIFNGCLILGPPNLYAPPSSAFFFFADTVGSLITDTIVLPYTIYGQVRYGNFPISQDGSK